MLNICVKHTKNGCIPERMSIRLYFWRWNHDERMSFGIDCVEVLAHVVGGIIDTEGGKAVYNVISNAN
jgi:hypothetical protein